MAQTLRGNNVSTDALNAGNSATFPVAPLNRPSQRARINPVTDQRPNNIVHVLAIHGRVAVISSSKIAGQHLDKPAHVRLIHKLRRRIDQRWKGSSEQEASHKR